MNLIDLAVIIFLLLYVLYGIYRGFIGSSLNLCALLGSCIVSSILYPFLSLLFKGVGFFDTMRFYIEGADRITTHELRTLDVSSITGDQLQTILDDAMLPAPFNSAVEFNISNHVFAGDPNTVTVGEYLEATLASVTVNILSFLILFVIAHIVFTLITNAFSYSTPLPVLTKYDGLVGGAIGFVRGILSMFILFMIIPVALVAFPVEIIVNIVNGSLFSGIFYDANMILGAIPTLI